MTTAHVELPGSRRRLAAGARRVRDIDPHSPVEVTITLKAPDLPGADKMPARSLTPEQVAQQFGASADTVQRLEKSLRSFGLVVEGVLPSGRGLRVSGTAGAMEAAFKAGLGVYHSAAQGEFRGREGTISVPADVDGLIGAVLGLDQRRVANRKAARPSVKATQALQPADLEKRYGFPLGKADNEHIAIAEFGSSLTSGQVLPPAYFPDDVAAFCAAQRRPTPNVETVPVNIAPLTLAQLRTLPSAAAKLVIEATTEVMMDVEIIAALCSGAKVSVYYASWDQKGWVDLLERVLVDRPVALSISYGLAEDSSDWAQAALDAINNTLQTLAMTGVTVCVSSGDDGSGCDQPDTSRLRKNPFEVSGLMVGCCA